MVFVMNKNIAYKAALYLRLSKNDAYDCKKTQSNSISSQCDMLKEYVKNHSDLQIFDIYADDGYSGADFKRPEFERMMKDIYAGNVNCVIVKDLSRFGRDYIEAGRFIQKTFPAFNVRFIAVTDNYDSISTDLEKYELMLPLKNFVNDSYCRDISMKVKAHQRVKRLEGKCISAFTVYGYLKSPADKHKLIADAYASDIVRKIFAWKISGMSMRAIADRLNRCNVLSPLEYKRAQGMRYSTEFAGKNQAKWSAAAVKRILTNRIYIGYMEQGKQEKMSYKTNIRTVKPQEEWIKVKNTHEPIVSENDFKLVQEILRSDRRVSAVCTIEAGKSSIQHYSVGIYCRLSVDIYGLKKESIKNQIDIIERFICENNMKQDRKMELTIYDTYIDSGISGMGFQRKGFERLMQDVSEHRVSCIIVKDLSRIGRNYLETGNLIENILPLSGCRFIAVCDNFDSMSADVNERRLVMNIKNLVNEMYARDIAKRVCTARRTAARNGSFTGGAAPYGYEVARINQMRRLEVNEECAVVVRKIFNLYAQGEKISAIIMSLYADKVHKISDYKKYGHVYCRADEILHRWRESSVLGILCNTSYLGELRQCRKTGEIVVKQTHEAIVEEELFRKVQQRIGH